MPKNSNQSTGREKSPSSKKDKDKKTKQSYRERMARGKEQRQSDPPKIKK